VYAFIATPVQLWHHHSSADKSSIINNSTDGQKSISVKAYGSSSHDCKICSHKYSIYNDDSFKPEQSHEFTYLDTEPVSEFFHIEAPCFNLSNKGPPVTV
jgi:hypothetical protein